MAIQNRLFGPHIVMQRAQAIHNDDYKNLVKRLIDILDHYENIPYDIIMPYLAPVPTEFIIKYPPLLQLLSRPQFDNIQDALVPYK